MTDHSGTTESLYLGDGLSSTSDEWVKTWSKKGTAPKAIEVPTITLNELLDREGIRHIDFLSMDIEGGEPKALKGLDIDRFRPELVGIETAGGTKDVVEKYFADHGYERIDAYTKHDVVNSYFRPKK